MAGKAAKGPPRRISQETFDEAVQQNIDDFDLEPDEAVADAVKEFELQNVDLSEIDKSYAGPEGRGEHPVVAPTEIFVAAVEAASGDPGSDEKRKRADAAGLFLRTAIESWNLPGWGAAVTGAGAVQAAHAHVSNVAKHALSASNLTPSETLLHALTASDTPSETLEPDALVADTTRRLCDALELLEAVLGADEARETFAGLKFPMAFTAAAWPACARAETAGDRLARMASFAAAVAAAATKSEANKGAFVKAEVETCLVAILNEAEAAEAASFEEGEDPDELESCAMDATRVACSAIRALTTGDDPREPASGAFAHARALAKAGAATALCAALAREAEAGDHVDLRLAQQLAAATRHVAVNDDICRETAERGGLTTTLRLLRGPVTGSARATKACAQLVRQLAGSDHVKGLILKHDGIAALAHCARVFAERAATAQAPTPEANGDANGALAPVMRSMLENTRTPKPIMEKFMKRFGHLYEQGLGEDISQTPASCLAATEQCVGALAAACLKNPEAATACASENVFEIVAEAMSSDVGVAHAGVQRQACMFFRNAVVRNPELRSVALATSAEASLRLAKKNHPKHCGDVASAALRDLGCDNYNEGYNPTTAVMGADGVVRTPEELGDEPDLGAVRAIAGYGSQMPSLAE